MWDKSQVDYSLYLVTGRELLPPGKDYLESLDESLREGHVTVVQIRCVRRSPQLCLTHQGEAGQL